MKKRTGNVVSVIRGRARVRFDPVPAAPRREMAASNCCTPAPVPDPDRMVEAATALALHRGDRVEVLVAEPSGLKSWLVRLLPALALSVAGAVAGGIVRGDAGAGIGIGVGLALGISVSLLVGRRQSHGLVDKARVLRIVGPAVPVEHCAASADGYEQRS
ncbi:SoxR reducing system RseC family protein [candidate division WOR-3 bacterium]|nr:SoxR reducing system RseC family protein [candidate division WOR-3 bacterium]